MPPGVNPDEKQLWVRRIVQALLDTGHIFKFETSGDNVTGRFYYIQA